MLFHRTVAAASAMAVAATAALVSHPAAAASGGTLTVNLASSTGPVLGGASGALYGLSENGVPGSDRLKPAAHRDDRRRARGAQHPSGHTDQVAPEFFGMGGKWLLDYMQDYYSQWPYQNVGIASYLSVVDTIVNGVRNGPDASRYVFVPFNEPDGIWYSLNPSNSNFGTEMTQFEEDWTTVFQRIRADDPGALIAGPFGSAYNATVMRQRLPQLRQGPRRAAGRRHLARAGARHGGVVPLRLRELPRARTSGRHRAGPGGHRRVRGPVPAVRAVPGEMVQLLAEFEDAKVYADLPFWDIADNYSDTTVRNDEPNGQWWLMDWYGQLTGRTVAVTPPQPDVLDTLQGPSALDTAKRDSPGSCSPTRPAASTAKVTGIDPAVFGQAVHVSVQSIGWTGYDGSAYTPLDVAETEYRVVNGTVTVPLGELNPSDAYQVVVTPASKASVTALPPAGTQTYLAGTRR